MAGWIRIKEQGSRLQGARFRKQQRVTVSGFRRKQRFQGSGFRVREKSKREDGGSEVGRLECKRPDILGRPFVSASLLLSG